MRVQATARARPRAESGRCRLAQAGVGSDQPGEIRGGSRGSGEAKDYEDLEHRESHTCDDEHGADEGKEDEGVKLKTITRPPPAAPTAPSGTRSGFPRLPRPPRACARTARSTSRRR